MIDYNHARFGYIMIRSDVHQAVESTNMTMDFVTPASSRPIYACFFDILLIVPMGDVKNSSTTSDTLDP